MYEQAAECVFLTFRAVNLCQGQMSIVKKSNSLCEKNRDKRLNVNSEIKMEKE